MSTGANVVRVVGLELYRYFLTDFMPGIAACLVLAYYARQYEPMRDIAQDYQFASEAAGGFFLLGLVLGVAFGSGLVINLLSTMTLAWITNAGVLTRMAAKLQCRGGLARLEDTAQQVMDLAKTTSRVEMIGLDGRIQGPDEVDEVQARVGIWLYREHPEDFQRIERYRGAAILCRSLAGVVLLTWLVEAYRFLTGQDLGVAPAWFPVSAVALIALLFGSAYANVQRTRSTLQVARQRLHEPDPQPSPEGGR